MGSRPLSFAAAAMFLFSVTSFFGLRLASAGCGEAATATGPVSAATEACLENVSRALRASARRECPRAFLDPEIVAALSRSRATDPDQKRFFAGRARTYYRGVAQPGYGERELVDFLFGDRQNEPRSWAFTHHLEGLLASGASREQALAQTDEFVRKATLDYVKAHDVGGLASQMMGGSVLGTPLKDKDSLGLSFSPELDEAKGYAETAENELKDNWGVDRPDQVAPVRAMIWEIKEDAPSGAGIIWKDQFQAEHFEYQAATRVSCHEVQGAYFGFYTGRYYINHSKNYGGPVFDWYHLTINSRDRKTGLPTSISLEAVDKNYTQPGVGLASKQTLCTFTPRHRDCPAAAANKELSAVVERLAEQFQAR